jgi:hypothetical protein
MSKHFEVKKAIADVNNQTKRNINKLKKKEERQFKRKRDRQENDEKFDTNDVRNYPSALDNPPNEHNNE